MGIYLIVKKRGSMKCLGLYLVLFCGLFSSALFSQTPTKVDLQRQVFLPLANNPVVMLVLPEVGLVYTRLDSNTLELFNDTNGLFLRAKTVAPKFKDDFFKVTTPTPVFKTTVAVLGGKTNLMVFYNGLLQREGEDYDVTQEVGGLQTVTFKNQISTGQFITLKYTIN